LQAIICFVSDFGLDDTWVGVCHAVIHRACPQARVVDLSHLVPPFDIRKGAVVCASGVWQLPDAIHLAVVDPGVGGGRRDVCLVTKSGTRLVGPDNGVLLPATWASGGVAEAYAIDPSCLDYRAPLPTFHARDILSPAAALLASGVPPRKVGTAFDPAELEPAPFSSWRIESGEVAADVLDIDRFGSVRIGIAGGELPDAGLDVPTLELGFGHLSVRAPLATTFSDVPEGAPVALVDSSGWLTLAVRMGSASERYGIEPGHTARLKPAS